MHSGSDIGVIAFSEAQAARLLRMETASLVAAHGRNEYYDFILEHGRRPNRKEAAVLGKMLGRQVEASDGSHQPPLSQAARSAARDEKRAEQADLRLDMELNRLLDAIALLAENHLDPAPLIARISPSERDLLVLQLGKAVSWVNRFASGWLRHVNIGNEEAEINSTGNSDCIERGGLRLIRSRDHGFSQKQP
jgi:hypothetical protein